MITITNLTISKHEVRVSFGRAKCSVVRTFKVEVKIDA